MQLPENVKNSQLWLSVLWILESRCAGGLHSAQGTLHILQGLQVHKAGQKILVDLTAMRIERSPLCQQQAGGCMVAIEVPYHTVAYHGGAIEVPWGGHWYTASVGPGLDYSQQASSLLYQNYVLEIAMSLLQRLSSCFSSWKRGAWQNVLFLILISSQDSCTEANTPDHTVEASTVQVDEVTSNEANNSSDSLLSNLFEKLFRLNQKLEVQEDDIFRLTLQVFKPHLCWLSFNCVILMSSKCKTLT